MVSGPKVVKREAHSVNGRKYGMFFHLDDGQVIYMAWRSGLKTRGYFHKTNSWCIDTTTLRTCEHRGVTAVGVAHRVNGKVDYYLTKLEDFWGEESTTHREGDTPQRALCRERFRVNSTRRATVIASKMKLR